MKRILIVASLLALAGCTDAKNARTFNFGQTGRVTCWGAEKVMFDDFSTGRIEKHDNSDGFYFVSLTTNRLTEITGDCTVDYGVRPAPGFKPIRP